MTDPQWAQFTTWLTTPPPGWAPDPQTRQREGEAFLAFMAAAGEVERETTGGGDAA